MYPENGAGQASKSFVQQEESQGDRPASDDVLHCPIVPGIGKDCQEDSGRDAEKRREALTLFERAMHVWSLNQYTVSECNVALP